MRLFRKLTDRKPERRLFYDQAGSHWLPCRKPVLAGPYERARLALCSPGLMMLTFHFRQME